MGIHNEPGNKTDKLGSPSSLVGGILSSLTDTKDKDRSFVDFKHDGSDQVVLLVNNLGGLSDLELGVLAAEAGKWLKDHKFDVQR